MKPFPPEAPASIFTALFVQVFMLGCLFAALLYDVRELALFSLIVLGMGAGAWLWSRVSLNNVRCEMLVDRNRLFPGERLGLRIRAINAKMLPVLIKIDLFTHSGIAGAERDQWIREAVVLSWYQQSVFIRKLYPEKRGVYNLGPARVRCGDLFGFFPREKLQPKQFEVVVYPRIRDVRPITLSRREFFGVPGARSPVEDPVFVFGTRDYLPGRPARGIHWKASARYHRLQEKLCEPARQAKICMLLDVDSFDGGRAGEDFERSLELIASQMLQMARQGIAVGFATNGRLVGNGAKIVPISQSPLQNASVLETLARVTVDREGALTDILERGYQIPRGTSCCCFAYCSGPSVLSVQTFLQHRHIPVRFVLARQSPDVETAGPLPRPRDTFYLKDFLITEDR